MKKPWKSLTAFGFGNLIRQAVTYNAARLDVVGQVANSPVLHVGLQQCYDCGALLTQERMSAHSQWHNSLYQNFMNVHGAIVQVSSPLLEIRERIETLEEKPATKVVKRPKKETGYVTPHRSGNPQSTIPMQIPADSASGDIFVYDAQKNALLRVQQSQPVPQGWSPSGPVMPSNHLSSSATDINALAQVPNPHHQRKCEWCGNFHYTIDGYTVVKEVTGVKKAYEVCKSCYDRRREAEAGNPSV